MAGHLGMWMPKQKDGKNWQVDYTATHDGEVVNQSRKFRVREDATAFIKNAKEVFSRNRRVTEFNFGAPYKI